MTNTVMLITLRYCPLVMTEVVCFALLTLLSLLQYYSYFDTVINHFLINNGRLDPLSSKTIGLCIESKCNYFSPVEFPCVVDAGMYISHKGRTSVKYEVGIFKQGSSLPSAHGHFVHVFVDSETRKPVPFGADMEIAMASIAIPPYPDER